jgi:hypothetical protein
MLQVNQGGLDSLPGHPGASFYNMSLHNDVVLVNPLNPLDKRETPTYTIGKRYACCTFFSGDGG